MSDLAPTVFVIDDDENVREALVLLFEQVGLHTEGFANGQDFLNAYGGQPGCVLVDVRMPGMSGLDLQRQLHERDIVLPVIIVTGHGDVPMAVRAMKLGAVDFIEKPFNDQELLDCVQTCIEEAVRAAKVRRHRSELRARIAQLSKREREVMDMILAGKYSKTIAGQLGISPKTVDVHRAHILEKIEVKSVAELVRVVMEAGCETEPAEFIQDKEISY